MPPPVPAALQTPCGTLHGIVRKAALCVAAYMGHFTGRIEHIHGGTADMQSRGLSVLSAAALLFYTHAAWAQRAGENAVTAAQDAFGTTVGNESIGLYSTGSARGFSPVQAGNIRVEGLYFYQSPGNSSQTGLDSHVSRGSTVRVGLSAQSYPFQAPTGIADFQLRLPGDKPLVSVVATYGQYETYKAEVDAQVPLIPGKLGLVIGAGGGYETYSYVSDNLNWSGGALLHWRPTETIEVIPFYSRGEKYDWEGVARIATAGSYMPPKVKRRSRSHPTWDDWETYDTTFGVLSRANLGAWTLRVGAFRSVNGRPKIYNLQYLNMQPDGLSDVYMVRDLPQRSSAYSGEMRLSGYYAEGPRRHTIHIATRGHTAYRSYGGGIPAFLGKNYVGVYKPFAEPVAVYGPQGQDWARQGQLGVSYVGLWEKLGEVSVGVQKAFYRRAFALGTNPRSVSHSRPWIYNGTLAVFVTNELTFYGSYARGLEESAVAPDLAANRGEALPANITKQVDAGLRYNFGRVKLVAGVFEVKKPYLDRNTANIYTNVGSIKHRGVELSLTGQALPGLTVIAGAVLLQPRVSGFTVDQGTIGRIPPGTTPNVLRLNLQYGPASWDGLSVETQIRYESDKQADRRNTFKIPSNTIVDLGARYQFAIMNSPASLRVQALNVTNEFIWSGNASSLFSLGDHSRRYLARLSVDF